MKKIILLLLIFVSSVLSAETVYVMSLKDYYDLCSKMAVLQTQFDFNANNVVLYKLRCYQEVAEKLKPHNTTKEIPEMTLDEKLSILGGKIFKLEIRIIQLEGKKK